MLYFVNRCGTTKSGEDIRSLIEYGLLFTDLVLAIQECHKQERQLGEAHQVLVVNQVYSTRPE